MNKIVELIPVFFNRSVVKLVLSKPVTKSAVVEKEMITQQKDTYQLSQHTAKQVFHKNLSYIEAKEYLENALLKDYRQCNSWDSQKEYTVQVSKKGKINLLQQQIKQPPIVTPRHNREKNYLLKEGTVIQPLIDMGIFTKEGKVVKSMYNKYRQINRFIEIIDDGVKSLDLSKTLNIIDFGCGKSYLTFILYYYFTQIKKINVNIVGLDLKQEVIDNCNDTVKKYGYQGVTFKIGDINGYHCDYDLDMVITLHACNTATDYALYNAIKWNSKLIFSVPCCQQELNGQIKSDKLSLITRYGIVKERAAALLTDAIRGNLLEYCGYRTQLLEFIDFDSTPKNIMIRATKRTILPANKTKFLSEVEQLMDEFSLSPTLYHLLDDEGLIE